MLPSNISAEVNRSGQTDTGRKSDQKHKRSVDSHFILSPLYYFTFYFSKKKNSKEILLAAVVKKVYFFLFFFSYHSCTF